MGQNEGSSVHPHINISPVDVTRFLKGVRALTIPELVTLGDSLADGDPAALEIFCTVTGAPPIRVGQTHRHVALELPASMIRPGDRIWPATNGSDPQGRQQVVMRVELERHHVRLVTRERNDRMHAAKPVWRRVGVRRRAPQRPVLGLIHGAGLGKGSPSGVLFSVG